MIARTSTLALLAVSVALAACSGSPATTSRILAAEGGTVTAPDLQVVIPAMSLAADTEVTLTVEPATEYPTLPNGLPEVLAIEPEGTILERAATVTIRADFVGAEAGESDAVFQLESIDGERWAPRASELLPSGDVTVAITRFAPIAVAVTPAGGGSGIRGTIRWGDATAVDGAPIQLFQGTTL